MITKVRKTKTTKSTDPQNPEAATSGQNQEPDAKGGKGSRENFRVVSVGFPSRTARQLRLLASVSGESIASIVVSAVSRVIAKRLPDALAEIARADADDQ